MAKKLMTWYLLLSKRLLKKPSFLAVLLLAPLLTAGIILLAEDDAHVLRIAVYAEPSSDTLGERIAEGLVAIDGVVSYDICSSEAELRRAVRQTRADAGYLIPSDLSEHLRKYAAGDTSGFPYDGHLIRVVTNDDNVQLQLAREQFYSTMYPYLSELIAEQFTLEQSGFSNLDEDTVRSAVEELYEEMHVDDSVFQFAYVDGETAEDLDDVSYLTAPIRGILSLFVLLTGMASALYLLQDRQEGRFRWVRYGYRGICEWLGILSGTAAGGAAAYLSLFFSGAFISWGEELILMLMLIFSVTGFCGILSGVVRNMTAFGTCIPLILLISAALTPVFISFQGWMPVKYMLPTFCYLNSVNSISYRWWCLLYLLAANGLYFVMARFMNPALYPGRRAAAVLAAVGRRKDQQ